MKTTVVVGKRKHRRFKTRRNSLERELIGLRSSMKRIYNNAFKENNPEKFVSWWNAHWSKIKELEKMNYYKIEELRNVMSTSEMAEYYGVSRNTISYQLKKRGLGYKKGDAKQPFKRKK